MRKRLISALMITCLVLSGCGGSKQKQLDTIRSRLTQAAEAAMTAQVHADLGDTTESYTLDYSFDGEVWTATVLQPEFIAGITAHITEHGSQLEYDGAILTTGDLTAEGVAPISALPMIWETLRSGTVDSVWTENDLPVGKFIYSDEISVTVWFDGQGYPMAGELAENSIVKATCTLTNVQIKETIQHGTTENENLGGDSSGESGI